MKKKLAVLVLSLSSLLIFLPSSNPVDAQIRLQIGRSHRHWDRGEHRGWYRGRHIGWYAYDVRRPEYVRQVYYINGRRYVRWVRYY